MYIKQKLGSNHGQPEMSIFILKPDQKSSQVIPTIY